MVQGVVGSSPIPRPIFFAKSELSTTDMAENNAPIDPRPVVWQQPDGSPVSCLEKLKVLNENLEDIRSACQDALEDAVLMGCDERQIRTVLESLVRALENPYRRT